MYLVRENYTLSISHNNADKILHNYLLHYGAGVHENREKLIQQLVLGASLKLINDKNLHNRKFGRFEINDCIKSNMTQYTMIFTSDNGATVDGALVTMNPQVMKYFNFLCDLVGKHMDTIYPKL